MPVVHDHRTVGPAEPADADQLVGLPGRRADRPVLGHPTEHTAEMLP